MPNPPLECASTVQAFKICETGIFAKDTPQKLFFLRFFGFATKNLNGGREINFFFCDCFFNLRSQTKPMHPMQISMHTNDTL